MLRILVLVGGGGGGGGGSSGVSSRHTWTRIQHGPTI